MKDGGHAEQMLGRAKATPKHIVHIGTRSIGYGAGLERRGGWKAGGKIKDSS